MAFAIPSFGRKGGAPAAAKIGKAAATKKTAPQLELMLDATESRLIAFGVQWKSMAAAGGRDEAIKQARAQEATHYILKGAQMGVGSTKGQEGVAGKKIYPAAAVAARHIVGNAVCLLRLDQGEYWLAAIANGAPTSRDSLLRNIDDAGALQEARQVIEQQFAGAAGSVTVYTNIEGSGIEGVKAYALEDLSDALVSETTHLLEVPKANASIPKPILYAVAALCALMLANKGWDWWTAKKRAEQAARQQVASVDPAAAWAQAVAAWEQGKTAEDGAGLLEARNQLMRLPVRWDGWTLGTAQCTAGALVIQDGKSGLRPWSCNAQYTREPYGVLNRDMAMRPPAGWRVTFNPLTGVRLDWSFQQPGRTFKLAELRKRDYFLVEVASRLQALMPALAGEVGFAFVGVSIPAPKKEDGTAMEPLPELQALSQSPLSIRAPLRTVDALINADLAADWQELSISYDKQELKGSANGSTLMAQVKGEIYAKD